VQGKVDQAKDAKVLAVDTPKPQVAANHAVPSPASRGQGDSKPEEGSGATRIPDASRSATAAAAKLKSSIVNAIANSAHVPDVPHIEVRVTPEGTLISITDDANYSMFAIGSAKPQPETVQIMEKIGQILKAGSESIVIRGYTDGRPYRSAIYDNWRLSSARAHMALYMLTRGGLSEKRIENVEGYADHHLKVPNNPNASENRRIEILLRKEGP
jgi:chemotaxis protein MotB